MAVWSTDSAGRLAFLHVGDAQAERDLVGDQDRRLQPGPTQHIWHRTTTGAVAHVYWSPSTGLFRETWGTNITTDPTATSVGSSQHVWSLDPTNATHHWWTEGSTVHHESWISSPRSSVPQLRRRIAGQLLRATYGQISNRPRDFAPSTAVRREFESVEHLF